MPGDIDEILLIKDCMIEEKRPQDPPFPTFYQSESSNKDAQDEHDKIYAITSQDIYSPNIFQFSQPSIVYTEADETKVSVRNKAHAKIAKAKKS